jgi:hypothetical protein
MNEKIKSLAEQAGIKINEGQETHLWWLERFAELVRQDEREACAKLCEEYFTPNLGKEIAAAIRARENT